MLLVNREARDNSGAVRKQLKDMLRKCEQDPNYALYDGAEELVDNTLLPGQPSGTSDNAPEIVVSDVSTKLENAGLGEGKRGTKRTNKRERKNALGDLGDDDGGSACPGSEGRRKRIHLDR